jgi:hypothetical protein
MLAEFAAARMLRTPIEQIVAKYAVLDPAVITVLGADRFPTEIWLAPQSAT